MRRPGPSSRAWALHGLSLLGALAACGGDAPGPSARPSERPWSVQLHVHGPWSEGPGSIDTHSREAQDLGLDVLWWSDHDFRVTSYRHVTRFGFEGPSEPLDRGEAWTARSDRDARGVKSLRPLPRRSVAESGAEFVADRAREGERSLRLFARHAGPEFAGTLQALAADRALATRPLASEVTVEVDVLAEDVGEDAHALVEVGLSEHSVPGARAYAPLVLRYEIGATADPPERRGTAFAVGLVVEPGRWTRLRLPVSQDARRGFPEIEAGDNGLRQIRVGVEARRGAAVAARFDALEISQEISGPPAFERQRERIEAIARRTPALVQLQGVELSYEIRHLNIFGASPLLLDYDALARESGLLERDSQRRAYEVLRSFGTRRAVEIAHARGDLVSYNHMFGVAFEGGDPRQSRSEVLEFLAAERVFGADLLEVGYRDRGGHDLDDHLFVWDELARRGLRPVGIGVSDSHGGSWRDAANNFVSWIFAPEPERGALLEGLRRGRVFFGDLARFDGELDLATAHGAVMGQIVLTDRSEEEIRVEATGLVPGDRLDLILSGTLAGRFTAEGTALRVSQRVILPPGEDAFVRAEVRDASGGPRAFSNPIHFVRAAPAEGLPPARAVTDLEGGAVR